MTKPTRKRKTPEQKLLESTQFRDDLEQLHYYIGLLLKGHVKHIGIQKGDLESLDITVTLPCVIPAEINQLRFNENRLEEMGVMDSLYKEVDERFEKLTNSVESTKSALKLWAASKLNKDEGDVQQPNG